MQTFDVSVNILNDRLSFSSAAVKAGMQSKKERPEAQTCLETPPKAVSGKCLPTNTVLFLGVVQLLVFSIVVSSQTSFSPVDHHHLWTLAGAVMLLLVPVFAFLVLPGPRCGPNAQVLCFVLFLHDTAICMIMHASPLVVIVAAIVTAGAAKAFTRFVDHTQGA